MKISFELEWKEALVISGAVLAVLGFGVAGKNLLEKYNSVPAMTEYHLNGVK